MNKLNQSMTISTEKNYANKWAELLGMLGYRCTSSKHNIKNNICRTGTNEQESKLWLLHWMLCVEIWWTGNSRYGMKKWHWSVRTWPPYQVSWNSSNLFKINFGEKKKKTPCIVIKALRCMYVCIYRVSQEERT